LDAIVGPAFISEPNWLNDTATLILEYFNTRDNDALRVPPMGLVRCMCGGKTRSLMELAHRLKTTLPDVAVIFVSLSDLRPWETNDQIGALCRRIAYMCLKDRVDYQEFEYENVQMDTILSWLGTSKRLLLIDELNKFSPNETVAYFLKVNFLMSAGHYFVFSSHKWSTQYFENYSKRDVVIRALPLIPSVDDASKKLNHNVPVAVAFFCGLIPALIYSIQLGDLAFPVDKRDQLIKESAAQLTESAIRRLLLTFITGDQDDFPDNMKPLLQVMDTRARKELIWIPVHLTAALKYFATLPQLPKDFAEVLLKILQHFELFEQANDEDDQGWEHLFIITLIIRVLSNQSRAFSNRSPLLLPISNDFYNCTVSYNSFCGSLDGIKTSDELLQNLTVPSQLPHIAVYVPTHSNFELYDVIVVMYAADMDRQVYGYQLKQGKGSPKKAATKAFTKSFLVRGDAKLTKSRWIVPANDEINYFFGKSGQMWTPAAWDALRS
jgi:hypothetical protein